MNNALILHGTKNNSKGNWFPWLKQELEKRNWKVWTPNLPVTNKPRVSRNAKYIFKNKKWNFDKDSVLISHSSGPATIWGILQQLRKGIIVRKCIFVSAFIESDWEKIKTKSSEFIFVHSDNDPYIPLAQAEELSKRLGAKLIVRKGQGHFNLEKGSQYKKFPLILRLIKK